MLSRVVEPGAVHPARSAAIRDPRYRRESNQRAHPGTNTYLLGRRPPYILLDTGEGKPAYLPVLAQALTQDHPAPPPDGAYVSDVILSHKHPDHHAGLPSVLALLKQLATRHGAQQAGDRDRDAHPYAPPRVHKFASPSAQAQTPDRWDALLDASLRAIAPELLAPPPAARALGGSPELRRVHGIAHGQEFTLTGEGEDEDGARGPVVRVVHTPGHTDDSICLVLPADRALFTADSVLGHGTAVFEDLAQYLASLQHLAALGAATLYPGHGPVVENGAAVIQQYIAHRMEREAQLLEVLGSRHAGAGEGAGEGGCWTVDQLLEKVYPPHVWEMARRGVLLHLHKLEVDGKVSKSQREGVDAWALS